MLQMKSDIAVCKILVLATTLYNSNHIKLTHSLLHWSQLTCSELKRVKSHAKTVVFLLSVRTPNIQVRPSRGSSVTTALIVPLYIFKEITTESLETYMYAVKWCLDCYTGYSMSQWLKLFTWTTSNDLFANREQNGNKLVMYFANSNLLLVPSIFLDLWILLLFNRAETAKSRNMKFI